MSAPAEAITTYKPGGTLLLWLLVGTYAVARMLQVYPGRTPMIAVVALHVIPPALFALLHGSRLYGWRPIFVFVAICLAVGTIFENLGVRTGFPYGHYYFTELMGPKIWVVPVLLALAYVGMAYLSWILACLILRVQTKPISKNRLISLPLLASLIMVSWDLSQEPIWSTVLHAWIWQDGGLYFGVPLTNFLGWYLTDFVIFQLFALYIARGAGAITHSSRRYLRLAVVSYALFAAGNLLLLLPNTRPSAAFDGAGVQWRVRNITETCALVTIFTMGAFAAVAWRCTAD